MLPNHVKNWALELFYDFKKAGSFCIAPPLGSVSGIAVPSFPLPGRPPSVLTVCSVKAGQRSNPWMHLLPADRLTCCTLIFVDVSHVYKEWRGKKRKAPEGWTIPPSFERCKKQTRPLMRRSGRGRFIHACVLPQLMNLRVRYLWMVPTTEAAHLVVRSICRDRHHQIGEASWVFSTCQCSF